LSFSRATAKPDAPPVTETASFTGPGNEGRQAQQMRGRGWLSMALTMKVIWFINVEGGTGRLARSSLSDYKCGITQYIRVTISNNYLSRKFLTTDNIIDLAFFARNMKLPF
jgi:hypothetical protein